MHKLFKKISLALVVSLFSLSLHASENCFIVQEKGKILTQEGDCQGRYAPCCSFNIALSLMGYHEGILIDETHPELPFQKGYPDWMDKWKQAHNPTTWMKNSCFWYSQIIAQRIGMTKFKHYLAQFNYGNQDASGDKGKNNGITNSWLASSLEISPKEHILFLQKLVDHQLPVSVKAHEMTKNILFVEDLPSGWKYYGKGGTGSLLSADRMRKLDIMQGWFVGWIQKGKRSIVFIHHIKDDSQQEIYPSIRAKAEAKERLIKMIESNNW